MTIKYNNKTYDVEYTQFNQEKIEIWIQNPDDLDDFFYLDQLPDHIQTKLYSLVDEATDNNEDYISEKMGYLD